METINFMSLKKAAPMQFYGIISIIVALAIGVIVASVLAAQSCKKDETSKFGNLIDTLKTAAEGTVEATKTIGESIGIKNNDGFSSVGAVDPLATVKLVFNIIILIIIALVVGFFVVVNFFSGDKKSNAKATPKPSKFGY
jgi:flagellar basal body-associated protein FliL